MYLESFTQKTNIQPLCRFFQIAVPAGIGFLTLTVVVDSIFWNRPLWPEGEVLWYNTVMNRSSDYGVSFLWKIFLDIPEFIFCGLDLKHKLKIPIGSLYLSCFILPCDSCQLYKKQTKMKKKKDLVGNNIIELKQLFFLLVSIFMSVKYLVFSFSMTFLHLIITCFYFISKRYSKSARSHAF